MKLGIPKEIYPGERRVAATPETTKKLRDMGFEVLIEAGAGAAACFSDAAYQAAGAEIVANCADLWSRSDAVLKVRIPGPHPTLGKPETELLREGGILVSFLYPAQNKALLESLAARKATVIGMDTIPRISRAQKMDALSSMANISGYRGVIEAAYAFDRFFMGQITAAGKVPPGKFLIIGAGVAGLAAIGAAKSLGAIVRGFDTRPVVREQVQSMGADFLEVTIEEDGSGEGGYAKTMSPAFIKAEMELFAAQAKEVDVIVTTALIPGQKAPILITADMVKSMKPGSVIVDLAAEQGGNCELTKPGESVTVHGVTIIGFTDLPSRMASQASQLYGTNLVHLLSDLNDKAAKGNLVFNTADEIVNGCLVIDQGKLRWPPPKFVSATPAPAAPAAKPAPSATASKGHSHGAASPPAKTSPWGLVGLAALAVLWVLIGMYAPKEFLQHFTVFVLAVFIGFQVVWNVTPALHTPLMSVTNAISGIIVVGGMLQLITGADEGLSQTNLAIYLGAAAILMATINIAGGFLVTQRMLKMFRK